MRSSRVTPTVCYCSDTFCDACPTIHPAIVYCMLTCVLRCVLQMVAALNGQFNELVERLIVIDCRYPYEFEGGHIKVFQCFERLSFAVYVACCLLWYRKACVCVAELVHVCVYPFLLIYKCLDTTSLLHYGLILPRVCHAATQF